MSIDTENDAARLVAEYRQVLGRLVSKYAQNVTDNNFAFQSIESEGVNALQLVPEDSADKVKFYHDVFENAACETLHSQLNEQTQSSNNLVHALNLLDLVIVAADKKVCDADLPALLLEDLMDSQTIEGCKTVFDYMESRRERLSKFIPAGPAKKADPLLRTCNVLLRRLSRFEDTVFCGRVYIFLFKIYPLGNRSSTNYKGEYHTENVTVFDEVLEEDDTKASDDANEDVPLKEESADKEIGTPKPAAKPEITITSAKSAESETISLNNLYPMFWSLQSIYANPPTLFETETLKEFKTKLEATMRVFKTIEVPNTIEKSRLESRNGPSPRKRARHEVEDLGAFTPKYLTSRDLFDLEVHDIAFRRHVLVQTLIVLDFLLSLRKEVKDKIEGSSAKRLYAFTLSEDDSKWATSMRDDIAVYLQAAPDGKFYYRMVSTVLTRDKNWLHWKLAGCEPFTRPPLEADDFQKAKTAAIKAAESRHPRKGMSGAVDLSFLEADNTGRDVLEPYRDPERYKIPTLEALQMGMLDDDMDIDFAKSAEEKVAAEGRKASKLWRMLRIASKNRFAAFNLIEDGKNLDPLMKDEVVVVEEEMAVDTPEAKKDDATTEEKAEPETGNDGGDKTEQQDEEMKPAEEPQEETDDRPVDETPDQPDEKME